MLQSGGYSYFILQCLRTLNYLPVEKVEHPKDIFAKTNFNFLGKEFENLEEELGKGSNTILRILSVRGVLPPPLRKNFRQKKVTDLGGTPLPPFTDIPPKNVLQKVLKMVFFAQKHLFLIQKVAELGGTPLLRQFFGNKGVRDLEGTPPPRLRTKSAK